MNHSKRKNNNAPKPAPDLRERLLRFGPSSLGDDELVALILSTGGGPSLRVTAATILDHVGGVVGLAKKETSALLSIRGVGIAKASRLSAAMELGLRARARSKELLSTIRSASDVVGVMEERTQGLAQESFWVLCLSAKGQVMNIKEIARGDATSCPVNPSSVFRAIVSSGAPIATFVHNHPSGDPTPSPADWALTRRLLDAAQMLSVIVLDHVIIGRSAHYSFAASSRLPGFGLTPRHPHD